MNDSGPHGDQSGSDVDDTRPWAEFPRFLDAVLQAVDALVVVLNRDGEIVCANNAACAATGLSEKEIVGRHYGDFVHDDEREVVDGVFADLRDGAEGNRHENDWVGKHGRRRVAWSNTVLRDDAGQVQYIVGTGRDVTAQTRFQMALRESEARLRGILNTAVDAVVVIDRAGSIELFNPAAEEMFGYSSSDVLGENVAMLMPTPYHEEHDGYISNYMKTGVGKIIGIGREVIGKRKDGSTFPIELSVSEVKTGNRLIFTGVIRDITERKQLQHEILTASEVEQRRIGQDLHDSLGQQLTGLAFLTGALVQKLMARGLPEAADAERIAEQVDRSIDHTRRLSRGLSPVDLVGGDLGPALFQLANDVKELAGIACEIECGEVALDEVTAIHAYRIAQEAVNNAVKHAAPSRIAIALGQEDDWITLTVTDNGIGFPKNAETTGGAGMRNMRRRAEMIGGGLTVSAVTPKGSRVQCSFREPLHARA